jgi:PAS domain S-box-containing protein
MPVNSGVIVKLMQDLQDNALSGADHKAPFDMVLNAVLEMSDSQFGFIGEIVQSQTEDQSVRTFSISSMKLKVPEGCGWQNIGINRVRNLRRLYSECLESCFPTIRNSEPEAEPVGTLGDLVPAIYSLLCLPIVARNRFIGIVGLVNRPDGYDNEIVEQLKPLIVTATSVLLGWKNDRARRRIEEEANEQRERLSMVVDSTGLGIWDWDINSKRVLVNERWAEMVGYRKTELEPVTFDTWAMLVQPDDLAAANRQLSDLLERKISLYSCDVRMRHKDGHWVTIRTTGKVTVWDADGKPVRAVGTHLDISEITNAVNDLRSVRSELAQVIDVYPDGLITFDEQLSVTLFNPAAEEMFGYTKEQVLGYPLGDLMPDEVRHSCENHLMTFLSGSLGVRRTFDEANPFRGRRSDGSLFSMKVDLCLIQSSTGQKVLAILKRI